MNIFVKFKFNCFLFGIGKLCFVIFQGVFWYDFMAKFCKGNGGYYGEKYECEK